MKTESHMITTYIVDVEPKDLMESFPKDKLKALQEVVQTHYISRVNIPVMCYEAYHQSDIAKTIKNATDAKTLIRYYITLEPTTEEEKKKPRRLFFEKPSAY